MKKPFFLSLNVKILSIIVIAFCAAAIIPMTLFVASYSAQIEAEAYLGQKKAETVWTMYEENRLLREAFLRLYRNGDLPESVKEKTAYLKPLLERDRFFSLQEDLLIDRKNIRNREMKMEVFSFSLLSFACLFCLLLVVLWILLRRMVLSPLEDLLDGTKRLENQEFGFRLPAKKGMRDELGELYATFNSMADALEAKVDALNNNRLFLQNLIDALPDGLRVIDKDFNVVMTNAAYDETCGESEPLFKKCHVLRLKSETPCAPDQCPQCLLARNGDAPLRVIQPFTDKDGVERFAEVAASVLKTDRNGRPARYTVEVMRPLDHEINFSHQQKLASLGILSSSVAHEMRNPLGAMLMMLENVLERLNDKTMPVSDALRYLTLIYNQITTCIDVTERLLKLARRPSGEKEKVALNDVLAQTASLMEYEAKKRGIQVNFDIENGETFDIFAVDADLRMVVLNLMQNAFDAMETGGVMTIRVRGEDGGVRVDFSDTGAGMSAEVERHIFEPFFSTKQTPASNRKGTGLGLSIVKSIVESSKGAIAVVSEKGKGTTFSLRFPKARD